MRILVNRNGQQLGPYTAEEATAAMQNGTLSTTDLAWAEGTPNWVPLGSLLASQTMGTVPPAPAAGGPAFGQQDTRVTPGSATASLVLGILSFFCGSILTAIPAVICGHMARAAIAREPQRLKGEGIALGGLITGYINIALAVLVIPMMFAIAVPSFLKARDRSIGVAATNNARAIAIGCAEYATAHGGKYPATLDELVPQYVADAKTLTVPTVSANENSFDYQLAGVTKPRQDQIVVISQWKSKEGQHVVAHVDGSAELEAADAAPSVSNGLKEN